MLNKCSIFKVLISYNHVCLLLYYGLRIIYLLKMLPVLLPNFGCPFIQNSYLSSIPECLFSNIGYVFSLSFMFSLNSLNTDFPCITKKTQLTIRKCSLCALKSIPLVFHVSPSLVLLLGDHNRLQYSVNVICVHRYSFLLQLCSL